MDDLILNQIKDGCPCFCDKEDSEIQTLIESLVNLLSVSLCWNDSICGTFLYGLREERFDYFPESCLVCSPCGQYKKFPLFYQADGSDLEIVSVTMYIYNGLDEDIITLESNQYAVRKGQLIVDLSTIPVNCCTCNCDEYELVVQYEAGYKKLPSCLLPLFCDLLVNMSLSLSGCGSLDECCNMAKPKAYQVIKSKKVGELSYTWATDPNQTSYIYMQMLNRAKLNRIAQLSCCNNSYNSERLWYAKSC